MESSDEIAIHLQFHGFVSSAPRLPPSTKGFIAYDFQGLPDFPARHGFMVDGKLELKTRQGQEIAELLQSWLFFGVLSELAGRLIDRPTLLQEGEVSFDTTKDALGPCVQLIAQNIEAFDQLDPFVTKGTAPNYGIEQMSAATFGTSPTRKDEDAHPFRKILLSVKLLVCQLRGPLLSLQSAFRFNSDLGDLLGSYMIRNGWCPHQVDAICSSYDFDTASQLALFRWESIGYDIHHSCVPKTCLAYNNPSNNYVTAHATSDCHCKHIGPSADEVAKIVRDGGIPLISVRSASYGALEVSVQPSNATSQYIAISHVWSDGMGNIGANTLPLCQIRRLSRLLGFLPLYGDQGRFYEYYASAHDDGVQGTILITRLGQKQMSSLSRCESPLFWIDTLCIPTDDQDLRMRAINKMDAVYAHANKVLVLDSTITRINMKTTPTSEILTRLAWSPWRGRCWTLQEGAMAKRCYFQCADGALSLRYTGNSLLFDAPFEAFLLYIRRFLAAFPHRDRITYSRAPQSESLSRARLEGAMARTIARSLRPRTNHFLSSGDKVRGRYVSFLEIDRWLAPFVNTWNELSRRSTTKADDIYIVLTNSLGFSARQINRFSPSERLKALVWNSDIIPFSLLYNSGRRLRANEDDYDRWVPSELPGSILTGDHALSWADDNHSRHLECRKDKPAPDLFLLNLQILPRSFFLVDNRSKKMFFIKTLRLEEDALSLRNYHGTCIVLERESPPSCLPEVEFDRKLLGRNRRGACFHATFGHKLNDRPRTTTTPISAAPEPKIDDPLTLQAVYDCPLRIWEVETPDSCSNKELFERLCIDERTGYQLREGNMVDGNYKFILKTGVFLS